MEEVVTILGIETKSTKKGAPMWTANTSGGKMSCFEKSVADKLFMLINKVVKLDIEMNGSFKNLKGIIYVDENATPQSAPAPQPQMRSEEEKSKKVGVCISYSKDLVVAGKIDLKDLGTKAKELLALYEEMIK